MNYTYKDLDGKTSPASVAITRAFRRGMIIVTSARNSGADDWKYVARFLDGPFELYDMRADPQERFNLYGQPGSDGKRTELAGQLGEFFDRHADPQYDIWKGGRSKARRLVAPEGHPDYRPLRPQ